MFKTLIVSKRQANMRLLQFLRSHCDEAISAKAIKRGINGKLCTVNGQIETFSTRILKAGDKVRFDLHALTKTDKPAPILTLYEDEELLVIDKPVGLICEPKGFFKSLYLVHRLDKETSGVLLVAKTHEMQDRLTDLFRKRLVEKFYLAIVDGAVKEEKGRTENFLGKKHSYQGQTIYGAVSADKGSKAITDWECLQRSSKASLLCCKPYTGRTHQIRVHLSEMGHPVLGDAQYAQKFRCLLRPKRTLLHAYRLEFIHPKTGEALKLKASIPSDFLEIMDQLGWKRD